MQYLFLAALIAAAVAPQASGNPGNRSESLLECIAPAAAGQPEEILVAAMEGDIKRVKAYLDETGSVRVLSTTQGTMLHYAAVGGQPDVVKLLLAHKADPLGATGYTGKTPREALLACAAVDADAPEYAAVVALLEAAEGVVRERSDRAAAALDKDDFGALQTIVTEGPLPHRLEERIIIAAVEQDNKELVAAALACDGFALPVRTLGGIYKKPAGDLSASEKLVLEAWQKAEAEMIQDGLQRSSKSDASDSINKLYRDQTPLMKMCAACNAQGVKVLLDAGADPAIKNSVGKKASDFVCSKYSGDDEAEIRRLLKEYGRQ